MLTCRDIAALATQRSEEQLDAGVRAAFDAHVAACAGCRGYVQQLRVAVDALHELPEPPLPASLEDAILRAYDLRRVAPVPAMGEGTAWAGALRRRAAAATAFAAAAALALLLGAARRPAGTPLDWTLTALLAAVALALAALAGRSARIAAGAAIGIALAAALAAGRGGGLEARGGIDCVAWELAGAAAVAGAAWLATRRRVAAAARWAAAAGGTVGALAADAALQVACPAHHALAHLLVFHAGGVALVGAAALWILRAWGPGGAQGPALQQ